nr:MAG TPA: hypothetical protein [Caudoviricetes sp.]
MMLSQEDNSSPALMSRAFSLLKIPTLRSLATESVRIGITRKKH